MCQAFRFVTALGVGTAFATVVARSVVVTAVVVALEVLPLLLLVVLSSVDWRV